MSLSPRLRINTDRFKRNFDSLAAFGRTKAGGVHRPALGEAHLAARRWFLRRAAEEALEVCIDGAGNHSAILRSSRPEAKTLLIGSHLDSVPNGGRFDGAFGVLAAFEVLCTIRDAGLHLPVHLEAIDFTDEEGTFVGFLGSKALTGSLTEVMLASPRGGGTPFSRGLEAANLRPEEMLNARRDPATLAAFLEIHIEQGPRLGLAAADIGIVESIAGIAALKVTFLGRADHSGTTPMSDRLDASLGASGFIQSAHALVRETYPGCMLNVGRMTLSPGVLNIVPEEASLWVEYRAASADKMNRLSTALHELGSAIAGECGLGFQIDPLMRVEPARCAESVRVAFKAAGDRIGLNSLEMDSGAGHDTMVLARICPAGMIFIPSTGGSHSAREFAAWTDCVNGANVLLQAALALAGEPAEG